MNLPYNAAHTWLVLPHYNEQVFCDKPHVSIHVNDLDINLCLFAHTSSWHFTMSTPRSRSTRRASIPASLYRSSTASWYMLSVWPPEPVMALKLDLGSMRGASWRMHVWWVKNHAVHLPVTIWKPAAINAVKDVGLSQIIHSIVNIPPKHALPIRHICDNASWGNVKPKYFWKNTIVSFHMRAQYKVVCGLATTNDAACQLHQHM